MVVKVLHEARGIVFTWDSRKAAANLRKHRVTFEAACEAFFDPFLQAVPGQETDGEFREAVLGFTPSWRLLKVVFVLRRDRIRLISARLATSIERKRYEDDPAS